MLSILKKEQNSLLLLLLAFFIFGFFHSHILYNQIDDGDAWGNVAYELYYSEYPKLWENLYKQGRAHFYIVHRWIRGIFQPVVSTTIFSWGYLFLAGVALFIFLYRRFNSNVAFIGTLLCLFFPVFISQSKRPDFYNYFAGMYFMWSLVFFQSAQLERKSRKQALFYTVSGFFFAMSFWAYIPFASLAPLFLFLHWDKYSSFRKGFNAIQKPLLFVSLGILGMTLFFGWINFAIYERTFLFPWVFLSNMLSSFGDYNFPLNQYFPFYLLVLLSSIAWVLYFFRQGSFAKISLALFMIYLLAFVVGLNDILYVLGIMKNSVLRNYHVLYYINYPVFLLIGLFLAEYLSKKPFSFKEKLFFTSISTIVGLFFYLMFLLILKNTQIQSDSHWLMVFIEKFFVEFMLVFLIGVVSIYLLHRYGQMKEYFPWKGWIVFVGLFFFSLIYGWVTNFLSLWTLPIVISWVFLMFGKRHWIKTGIFILLFSIGTSVTLPLMNTDRKDGYLAYLELSQLFDSMRTSKEKQKLRSQIKSAENSDFRLWFANQEILNKSILPYLSMFKKSSYGLSFLEQLSPDILMKEYRSLKGLVVVEKPNENNAEALIESYKALGLKAHKQAEFPYRRGDINWKITVLRFQKD